MSALDQLLVFLLGSRGSYFTRMLDSGCTAEEVTEAFNEARRAGYTEATGLGADRLTDSEGQELARLAMSKAMPPYSATTGLNQVCNYS